MPVTGYSHDMRRALLILSFIVGCMTAVVQPAAATENSADPVKKRPLAETVCPLLETHAQSSGMPPGFFARLIWQESRFNPGAVSPKGAQGIAQFMPYTATERGLKDPFDLEEAIPHSARLLAELRSNFGNWGLAAAAYNAGSARVQGWLDGNGALPFETQDFVRIITGLDAKAWAAPEVASPDFKLHATLPFSDACRKMAALARPSKPAVQRVWYPWGVQVAGNFSRAQALAAYQRVRARHRRIIGSEPPMVVSTRARGRGTRPIHAVRVGAKSRGAADQLCGKLRSAGAACMVIKN